MEPTYRNGLIIREREGKKAVLRPKAIKNRDDQEIVSIWLKGNSTILAIMDMMNAREGVGYQLTYRQVQKAIEKANAEWASERLADISTLKRQQIARLDQLEAEYWRAWERSLRPVVRVESEVESQELPGVGEREKEKEPEYEADREGNEAVRLPRPPRALYHRREKRVEQESVGDKRWLEGVQWCIEERNKILELDNPVRQEIVLRDWRKEALESGISDPDAMVKRVIDEFIKEGERK